MCISLEGTPLSFTLSITPSSATALFSLCCIFPSSLHLPLLLPISLFLSQSISHSYLLPLTLISHLLSAKPNIMITHNVYTMDMQARMNEHTHAYAHINVQMHARAHTHSSYKDTHRHWEWQTGSLLHSNTLRICRATLPISGTLLRTVDFWREKHTVMSTAYQLMPQLPTPPPATWPSTE